MTATTVTMRLRSRAVAARRRRNSARGLRAGRPNAIRWAARTVFAIYTLGLSACRSVRRAMAYQEVPGLLEAATIAVQCVALMVALVH